MNGLRYIGAGIGALLAIAGVIVAAVGLAGALHHMGVRIQLDQMVTGIDDRLDQALGDRTWTKFIGWLGLHWAGMIVVALCRSLYRVSVGPKQMQLDAAALSIPIRRWTEAFCVGLIIIALTYVNLVKNVGTWNKFKAMPEVMYGLHAYWWFSIGYLAALVAFVVLAVIHLRRPLALIPQRWLGKGQMLFLTFLWIMVIGNLMRAIPPFHQQRLITEGVIIASAILTTALILLLSDRVRAAPQKAFDNYGGLLGRTVVVGLIVFFISLGAQTGITWLCYGDDRAPGAGYHVRFGPNATAKGEPKPGQPHP
jgi:hypothetical protein